MGGQRVLSPRGQFAAIPAQRFGGCLSLLPPFCFRRWERHCVRVVATTRPTSIIDKRCVWVSY